MRWYYRLFDQEFGPSGLDELSEMVRQGTLSATDLVRPADSQEWQPAECDAVLGLQFLQDAGLQDAEQTAESDHYPATSLEWQAAVKAALLQRWKLAPKSEAEIAASTEGRLSTWLNAVWRYPLWGVITCVIWGVQALIWLVSVTIGQLAIVRRLGLFLAQAIDVTLILIEESKSFVRKAIVVFLTVSVMGICGYSLWSWTAREQLRFPSHQQVAVTYLFPFVGPCEPAEYWFWLINTMTVAGLVTCGFAIWLVRQAK